LAHVPAQQGARYGRPSAQAYPPTAPPGGYSPGGHQPGPGRYQPGSGGYQPPTTPGPAYGDGWDTPTHTVSSAYQTGPRPGVPERGVAGWFAVLVLILISAIGGAVDVASGSQVRGGFNVGIVVASIVAIIIVRRHAMFPVVVAPPLVYFAASAIMLYARSGGLHDRKVLLDAAANWLVYGFPAIAGATAAVLIIAGIRMFSGR
jgi:hypothetical protein